LTDYGDKTDPAPSFTNTIFCPSSDEYGNCIRVSGSFVTVENLYFHNTVAYLTGKIGFETMWELGAVYINRGLDLGYRVDIADVSVPQAESVDMGAFEFK